MPKKGHTEEQIVAVLRQAEAGEKVSELCRKVGISEATYYAWKKQYAGLGVSELRELRQLRDENGRLKRLVADLSLDRQILQERSCQKSCKARAAAEAGPLGSANVSDRAAASRAADESGMVDLVVSQESTAVRGSVAASLVRDGGDLRALRISALDRDATTGRLEGKCEADLPTVRGGAVDCAHQAAEENRPSSTPSRADGSGSECVLEHGLCE